MTKLEKLKGIHRVRRNGKVYRYLRLAGGRREPMPDLPEDDPRFIEIYYAIQSKQAPKGMDGNIKAFAQRATSRAKGRAAASGVPFGISDLDVLRLIIRQGGKCAMSGIEFSYGKSKRCSRRPFAPSLDRISTEKGYVPGNIRIVCQIANFARHAFTDRELMRFCLGYVETNKN